MPFFGKRKESGNENKSKLENKLYLAREDPEPVFDISDCDLKNVPPGIFSLCKVFRKESLCLQNNRLASLNGGGNLQDLSLLQVLDLHCNCLAMLPNEIRFLKILKVLNVSYNKLTELPGTIGALSNLITLNASHNKLKELTPAIGDLRNLQELDIQGNHLVTALPSALCHATSLKSIVLDPGSMRYPPTEVASLGTHAIMQYLARDDEFDYQAAVDASTMGNAQSSKASSILDVQLQDERTRGLLALAVEKEEQQRREFELYSSMGRDKEELRSELWTASARLDGKLREAAANNESDRLRLVAEIVSAENKADKAVTLLLDAAHHADHHAAVLSMLELAQEQEVLAAASQLRHSTLRREEILRDMQEAVSAQAKIMTDISAEKSNATQALIEHEAGQSLWLTDFMVDRHRMQASMAQSLERDESTQKAAVAALLERSDSRSWALVQQVQAVEKQLLALTNAEVRRKQLDLEQQGARWAEQRVQLSALLMDLLAAQAKRKEHFLRTVVSMEQRREAGNSDFWLEQYQRLVDSMPPGQRDAEAALDPRLAARLVGAGAFHALPLLAQTLRSCVDLRMLDDLTLQQSGLRNESERKAVLNAIRDHLDENASGPAQEERSPSAPSAECDVRPECVICMEEPCGVLLVPCGHVCVCAVCAAAVSLCPLCRAEIVHKVRAIWP